MRDLPEHSPSGPATARSGRAPGVPPTFVDGTRLWVDARLRALVQARIEARLLRRLGGPVLDGRVLELGTGRRGTGLRSALDTFGAAHADGVEIFPASVADCRAAVRDLGDRVQVSQGDATRLSADDAAYDAVFGWHVLHHTEDWRAVVAEAARVLRPGGRFYSCEMTARFIDSRVLRAVSAHPADGDRPTPATLAEACRAAGLTVTAQETRLAGCWTALVATRS
ncbi:class I SAM-dependent methyltransferase [Modestobacter sp. VKM Ac-2977]|uniref:class I SAM-dependent methyltransferase n=1 Tax=unclassified Modestobacter TaxID=2643866 RepID=UPI0022AACF22|nr:MULTISPECIES: class I SAM-dependent methyltransferase [unclassified Modestobacter]MCZ2811610.1 class I SAM-dependent methyltransferase [Modestobacter sp. VKM Ac-2979]MCZ2820485.1 class I SAM-dependent methyltransferase [Modestobacter sp. VKM Ac-2977]MCZ2843333.1 class I SAM-dependent methyltransferase [Modestobacter sp. VKM Ac-2980]